MIPTKETHCPFYCERCKSLIKRDKKQRVEYNNKEFRLLSNGKFVELDRDGKVLNKEITLKDMLKVKEDVD